jgi:hypothetical protein
MTPDPYKSAKASNPQSWNQYAYVTGDPVNLSDPNGTDPEDPGPPSYCFDDPQGMFDPMCTCPNGICGPPTGSANGTGLPPNVPCYQNYNQIQNTLNNVADDLLSKILADPKLNLSGDQVHDLTDLLLTTSADEVMDMQGYDGSGPDPAYYKGGHFNLVLNDSDLASALGLTVGSQQFLDFQSYIQNRFQTAALGDPSLHGNNGPIQRGGASNTDYFHLDSADAYQRFPLGLLTHFGRDVVGGQVPQWFGKYPCLDQGF